MQTKKYAGNLTGNLGKKRINNRTTLLIILFVNDYIIFLFRFSFFVHFNIAHRTPGMCIGRTCTIIIRSPLAFLRKVGGYGWTGGEGNTSV